MNRRGKFSENSQNCEIGIFMQFTELGEFSDNSELCLLNCGNFQKIQNCVNSVNCVTIRKRNQRGKAHFLYSPYVCRTTPPACDREFFLIFNFQKIQNIFKINHELLNKCNFLIIFILTNGNQSNSINLNHNYLTCFDY